MRPIVTALTVYVIAAAAVLGLQLLAVTALLAWRSGALDLDRDGLATLLVGVPASSAALIVIAVLAARRPRRVGLRLAPSRVPPRAIVAMVVGMLALSQALESLVVALGVGRGPALEWVARGLASASATGLLLAVLVIGVLAPLGEELFFRGYMLTRLREAWRAGPAILVTALAFGLVHGEAVHGVLAAGIGLYLGFVVERSASVLPALICHVANNTVSVLLTAWMGSPPGRGVNAVLVVGAGLVFGGSMMWLRRLPRGPR
ncbi:MAG TPA: type II CAAX endopeptidase family protein [Methylomirabilota bacterium]|jgi:membrane protease YdiL (CAAX protease family)